MIPPGVSRWLGQSGAAIFSLGRRGRPATSGKIFSLRESTLRVLGFAGGTPSASLRGASDQPPPQPPLPPNTNTHAAHNTKPSRVVNLLPFSNGAHLLSTRPGLFLVLFLAASPRAGTPPAPAPLYLYPPPPVADPCFYYTRGPHVTQMHMNTQMKKKREKGKYARRRRVSSMTRGGGR